MCSDKLHNGVENLYIPEMMALCTVHKLDGIRNEFMRTTVHDTHKKMIVGRPVELEYNRSIQLYRAERCTKRENRG